MTTRIYVKRLFILRVIDFLLCKKALNAYLNARQAKRTHDKMSSNNLKLLKRKVSEVYEQRKVNPRWVLW